LAPASLPEMLRSDSEEPDRDPSLSGCVWVGKKTQFSTCPGSIQSDESTYVRALASQQQIRGENIIVAHLGERSLDLRPIVAHRD